MTNFSIEQLSINEVAPSTLDQLESLYANSYHDSHMYPDLLADMESRPEVFRLFLARLHDSARTIVGARVIESKIHDNVDYHNLPPVHGKRFSVSPDLRGKGIGRQMIQAGKQYCFEELGLRAIFGESNEIGALALYGREGALYKCSTIENSLRRTTPAQNMEFFAKFLTDPDLRGFRYPTGGGIHFVYCRDLATTQFFQEQGYISQADILAPERKTTAQKSL
jgi:GNAT superfamily N-acetyltransferase